jgi:hypothetical protein
MNEQMDYNGVRVEKCVDEGGNISVNIYGSASKFPVLVIKDFETIRMMRNFLDHVVHEEFLKLCR